MVAFEQYLIAPAHAHQLMAQFVNARRVVSRREEQQHSGKHCGHQANAFCASEEPHQSPAPAGAGRTPTSGPTLAGTEARAGAALGTRAKAVPKSIPSTPTHIHETNGFK